MRGMKSKFEGLLIVLAVLVLTGPAGLADELDDRQLITTGPEPPAIVVERDREKARRPIRPAGTEVVISGVPPYFWRHGCGPTAVGMVIGYYDGQGYDDLIPGCAFTQTGDVDQAIASQGDASNPRHYEDAQGAS